MKRPRNKNVKDESEGSPPSVAPTADQIRQRTLDRAIKLLAARSRSVEEMRELLLHGPGSSKIAVEEAVSRLREYGYLDDERFAFGYASLKLRQRPLGRQRLKRDLSMKKVDRAVADQALDLVYGEVSEAELIDRAIEKRTRLRGHPKNRAQAKSLFDHLMRQGFPYELVAEKVRAASRSEIDDDRE